ncbi:helix-turn-helix domain-containing protein [Endozoicomonas gorgoniicola]|uniref:Helix-turn-helix domain-containing protein n=1 Tax=Endozoicomonas gorgoniicola TaxID=1234144 RepID=A0ABT3N4E9_9GAMM|nr:helix-turn-helix transcriptional regulator [Endozoicomonas gorgoniicola]MCW7556463.1 helix-turn-helix domain-containing protein [Endozoicomonas gorgoniicola]MCW7556516.1 helix-turn-helix domain-containing protein [Endozoicomonas gorgoniicola]
MNNNSIVKADKKNNPQRPYQSLGQCIRTLREGEGLSITDAADRIGCGESTLQEWEAGLTLPKDSNVRKLAQIFDTTPANLLLGMSLLQKPELVTEENAEEKAVTRDLWTEIQVSGLPVSDEKPPHWLAPDSEQEIEQARGTSFTGSTSASFGISRVTGKGVTAVRIVKLAKLIELDDLEIAELLLGLGVPTETIRDVLGGWA